VQQRSCARAPSVMVRASFKRSRPPGAAMSAYTHGSGDVDHDVYVYADQLTICVRLMLLRMLIGVSFCTGSGPMSGCRPTGSMERLWLGVVPKGEAVVPTPLKEGPPRPPLLLMLLPLLPKGLAAGAPADGGDGGDGGDGAMMCCMSAECCCVSRAAQVAQHHLHAYVSGILSVNATVYCPWYACADNRQRLR
jgi:hypothetical protein